MSTAIVADDPIAGVAANPIARRGLNDSDEKRLAGKFAFFDSQIALKLGFFADRANFWHNISFLKVQEQY
jgi:hypothetical protein